MAKATLVAESPSSGKVEFQFNPNKYQVQKSLEWTPSKQKGSDAPPLDFVQGKGRTVSMEIFMDDYEKTEDGKQLPKVIDRIKELNKFTVVDPATSKDQEKAHPPVLRFMWGGNEYAAFKAVINTLNITYTLFHEDGRPARANVSLSLREWIDKPGGQNPTSMGSASVRTHQVIEGETLDLIAYHELGAAHRWKYIAELNNLDDPLSIRAGQRLLIAPLR